jgi:carboxypeptidase C (cathepsin A)
MTARLGKVTASMFYTFYVLRSTFYTFYERTDVGEDRSARPLAISFNGGPGSASLWMHIAYTGPVQLNILEEGYPLQPYGTKPNPHSILDVADIVYIDPVNTGFSRILDKSVDRCVQPACKLCISACRAGRRFKPSLISSWLI